MSGEEWIVEAFGCDARALADLPALEALFSSIIVAMFLHPVGETHWHQFPDTGGITGLCLLSESHLTCHTFPEHRSLCLNVFCCRPRDAWDFAAYLKQALGADEVRIRHLERPYA